MKTNSTSPYTWNFCGAKMYATDDDDRSLCADTSQSHERTTEREREREEERKRRERKRKKE